MFDESLPGHAALETFYPLFPDVQRHGIKDGLLREVKLQKCNVSWQKTSLLAYFHFGFWSFLMCISPDKPASESLPSLAPTIHQLFLSTTC